MATGVKPRDEDLQLSKNDLEVLQDAFKDKEFRKLLAEYCEEIRDPANQALYQKEMIQLEKERGVDITFINPKPGYVIKTSVAGDKKAFINICSNENIVKPSCVIKKFDGRKGLDWQIPYSLIPPREDYCKKRERCVLYDVVFHPDTLRMAEHNKTFRDLVNTTAFDALKSTYDVELDRNNFRFVKAPYKGMISPAVIRKEDPNFKPENVDDSEINPEVLQKLYPQRSYPATAAPNTSQEKQNNIKNINSKIPETEDAFTIPKYTIKQQKHVDLQDFTNDKNNKKHTTIPSQLVVEINLPLISSTAECVLDVRDKQLKLTCEKPARYELNLSLPYSVNEECGNAKFDKSKRLLIVTLPVNKRNYKHEIVNSLKLDSGVDSEEHSNSGSDEDPASNYDLVTELESEVFIEKTEGTVQKELVEDPFLDSSVCYTLPSFTHNVLDNIVAFTFHVKNSDSDTVVVQTINKSTVALKFTSIGAGFVPVYYSAYLKFEQDVSFHNVTGEAWDNNVIVQLEVAGPVPSKCLIGKDDQDLVCEYFDLSLISRDDDNIDKDESKGLKESLPPVIEVANLGIETNITVTSHDSGSESYSDYQTIEERNVVWRETIGSDASAKGILRNGIRMARSLSESSVGDVASSMDYFSSDCIPEESSLKKTVRFNDVIAKQFYRLNSCIEGQKKKNQRKKNKKRGPDRRKSESEAEDDAQYNKKESHSKPKFVEKTRRDSGLADTSEAEGSVEANKTTNFKSTNKSVTCDSIKHQTELYNPEKLNKGLYLEVNFKNDLIFDLDM